MGCPRPGRAVGLGFGEDGETVRGLAGWNILVPIVWEENMGRKKPASPPWPLSLSGGPQIAEKRARSRGALLGSGAKTGLSGQPGRLLIPPGYLDSCERS